MNDALMYPRSSSSSTIPWSSIRVLSIRFFQSFFVSVFSLLLCGVYECEECLFSCLVNELVEQVMTDYGIRKEVIERVKRRVAHTNKYERDPVQFRRLLEGQRLKQSTVQMIVEDVFDEYVGRGAAEPYMGYDYAWRQHGTYGAPYHYSTPYPVPSQVGERVIERPLPSGGVERIIYVGGHEKGNSELERRIERIERILAVSYTHLTLPTN